MKLHWCPKTRSFTVLWLLEELGVDYQRQLVDIRAGDQDRPEYRAVNPMGKVPAIEHEGTVVTEQGAICVWAADRFPKAGLAPGVADADRGAYLRWLFFAGNCIEPAYMQKAMGWTTEKSMAQWGNYELVADVLEDALRTGPWILGDKFTAADVMIGSGVHFGLGFGLLDKREAFTAYQARCAERPALKRALEIEAAAEG